MDPIHLPNEAERAPLSDTYPMTSLPHRIPSGKTLFICLYLAVHVLDSLYWLPHAHRANAGIASFFLLAVLGTWVLREDLGSGWAQARARPWRTLGVLVTGLLGAGLAAVLGAVLQKLLEQVLGLQSDLANDTRIWTALQSYSLPVLVAALAVAGPIVEELVFRGLLLSKLAEHCPAWLAVVVSGVAFGAIHASAWTLTEIIGVLPHVGFGIAVGALYRWSKNLWPPICVHVLTNLSAVLGSA